tara:strand:+ start:806 stop:1219 length:414 start_codon:yes stop_codon:yes gene_type:complete
MAKQSHKELKSLGSNITKYKYEGADRALLERFPNKHPDNDYEIEIIAPEFTSLCPKTGQPDYATIKVIYSPHMYCVESKSFKLYLNSFRMHGEFHEECTNRILNDLVNLLYPQQMAVHGLFTPRGGISFQPVARYAK